MASTGVNENHEADASSAWLDGLKVGDSIWFAEENRPYRVRAREGQYLVCTKPFNPKRTVLYCIVDIVEGIRGPENLVFGMGAETDEQCREMAERVSKGETEISYRYRIPLNIAKVKAA